MRRKLASTFQILDIVKYSGGETIPAASPPTYLKMDIEGMCDKWHGLILCPPEAAVCFLISHISAELMTFLTKIWCQTCVKWGHNQMTTYVDQTYHNKYEL